MTAARLTAMKRAGFSRARPSALETSRRDAREIQPRHRSIAIERYSPPRWPRGDSVPRSDLEFADATLKMLSTLREAYAAASGMRDRHVSVRHSVFRIGACADPNLASHTLCPSARRRQPASFGKAGENSAIDPGVSDAILRMERSSKRCSDRSSSKSSHLPSRCARCCGF